MNLFTQILIIAVALILGYWLGKKFVSKRQKGFIDKARREKEQNKAQILTLFEEQEKIKNHDVQELLGVSDATVTRYLDELEEEGKITQHGDRKSAYYTRN